MGAGLGRILTRLRDRNSASRFAVAGSDTFSFATRAFGADALSAQAKIARVPPLLKARFPVTATACNGIAKGGQICQGTLFMQVCDGVA